MKRILILFGVFCCCTFCFSIPSLMHTAMVLYIFFYRHIEYPNSPTYYKRESVCVWGCNRNVHVQWWTMFTVLNPCSTVHCFHRVHVWDAEKLLAVCWKVTSLDIKYAFVDWAFQKCTTYLVLLDVRVNDVCWFGSVIFYEFILFAKDFLFNVCFCQRYVRSTECVCMGAGEVRATTPIHTKTICFICELHV